MSGVADVLNIAEIGGATSPIPDACLGGIAGPYRRC